MTLDLWLRLKGGCWDHSSGEDPRGGADWRGVQLGHVGLEGPGDIQKAITRREAIGFMGWTRRNAWAGPKDTAPCDARVAPAPLTIN